MLVLWFPGNQQQVMKTALARLFPTAAPITFCEVKIHVHHKMAAFLMRILKTCLKEHLAHLRKRQWLEEAKTT